METKSIAKYQFSKKTDITYKWKLLIYFHILFVLRFLFLWILHQSTRHQEYFTIARYALFVQFCRRSFISGDLSVNFPVICQDARDFTFPSSLVLLTRRGRVSLHFHMPIAIFKAAATNRTQEPSSNLWFGNRLTSHTKAELWYGSPTVSLTPAVLRTRYRDKSPLHLSFTETHVPRAPRSTFVQSTPQ